MRTKYNNGLYHLIDRENLNEKNMWFTSLNKIAIFLGVQRVQVEIPFRGNYAFKGRWEIVVEDGGEIPYKYIDNNCVTL